MKKTAYIIALCGIILAALATMRGIRTKRAHLSPSSDAAPVDGSFDPHDYSESSSDALIHPGVHHTAVRRQKDPYAEAGVIASKESALAEKGRFKRVKLVECDLKYPLIRIEETVARDSTTGRERVLERKAMVADHIMVKLQSGVREEQLQALNGKYGGRIRKKMRTPGLYLVEFPDADLDTVSDRVAAYSREKSLIKYSEPDYVVHAHETYPNDPQFPQLWGLHNTGQSGGTPDADIDAPEAWDINTGTVDVVVGVIDTGVDYNHEDLAANIWTNPLEIPTNGIDEDGNGYIDDVYGWDFYNNDSDPYDDHEHGTHCSGTIGAVGNNGTGVVGVVWCARIMALKFLNANGDGFTSDAIDAVNYATMMRTNGVNIRLTSNSWGGGGFSQPLHDAIAASGDQGMLFIAASGNGGKDFIGDDNDITPHYPSSYDLTNLIAVAAIDDDDGLASFSNYGETSVDLGAPGVSIKSTLPGNSYDNMSGTSMATPHVSGVAALVWGISPSATYQEVRNAILNGVDHASALAGKTLTEGRLNAYNTLLQVKPTIEHTPLVNTTNTVSPYIVDATVTPAALLDTNKLWVLSNTTGFTNSFTTNAMSLVTNDLYRGEIPAEPLGTTLYYYLYAETINGFPSVDPTNAPGSLHSFEVVGGVDLVVTGTPVEVGTVTPDYGPHTYPSGMLMTASAIQYTEPTNGTRYAVTGWVGSGSVAAAGASNTLTFNITTNSTLDWQWAFQYGLTQTSSVAGILSTTTWWIASATAQTVTAEASVPLDGTNYCFAEWQVEGARQPDATNTAVNPAGSIAMTTCRVANAVYLPEDQDDDLDNMADWWERYYFGSTNPLPGSDADSDGFSNSVEFLDRTDPRDTNSFPSAPVIIHTPLSDPQTAPAPWIISATVTDNFSVACVTLCWSRAGAPYQETNMVAGGAPDQYAASIPAPGTNGDSFAYYILAWDQVGFTDSNGLHSFYVAYPIVAVAPTTLVDTLVLPGTSTNRDLVITNSGNTNLVWEIFEGWEDDVESGANDWTHGGANDLWHISTNRFWSSAHSWYCGYESTREYGNSMHATLETPSLYLGNNAQMTFRHWMDSELDDDSYGYAWDGGIVEVSTNNGISYQQITPVGGYSHKIQWWAEAPWPQDTPCFAGTGGWEKITFDLSGYAGRNVVIQFHFGTDDNTVREGWYIDDIVIIPASVTNDWLAVNPTNGVVPPSSSSNLTVTFDSTGIPTGDRGAFLRITCNDPCSPTNDIPVSMNVRSPVALGPTYAAQTSTNGQGYVTISNTVYDVDEDTCELELLYSTNSGSAWTNAWVLSAQSSLGPLSVSNGLTNQITGIVTTNGGQAATNQLAITWDTTNSPTPIVLSTNTLVRARAWDGIFWSVAVTSSPFMVDNEPPTVPSNLLVFSHVTNTWSTNNAISMSWDSASDGAGAGMAGYGYTFTNSPTAEAPSGLLTTNLQVSSAALPDGTNWWAGVRAIDEKGNAGPTTNAGPYWIDATAPAATGAVITITHSLYGNYTFSTVITSSWTGFTDAFSGIAGYYYSLTDNGGTTNGEWTASMSGISTGAVVDQTNFVHVWARDNLGLIGSATNALVLVLDTENDFDQDGLLNSEEEIAGTDAGDRNSVFAFASAASGISTGGYSIVVQWNSITNRVYSVYDTVSLTNESGGWIPTWFTNVPGSGGMMSYTDVVTGVESRFYRLTVSLP